MLRIYDRLNQETAIQFADYLLDKFPFRVEAIQTDSYRRIGATRYISRNTVKAHLRSICLRLGVSLPQEVIERAVDLRCSETVLRRATGRPTTFPEAVGLGGDHHGMGGDIPPAVRNSIGLADRPAVRAIFCARRRPE